LAIGGARRTCPFGVGAAFEDLGAVKRFYWIVGTVAAAPVALKLAGLVAWGWLVVFLPALAGLAALALLYLFLVIFAVGYGAAAREACQAELSPRSRPALRVIDCRPNLYESLRAAGRPRGLHLIGIATTLTLTCAMVLWLFG
jgi:hypothetical protein